MSGFWVSRVSKFWKFHRDNPQVYTRLIEMTRTLWRTGVRKYSINGLFEVLRWEKTLETTGEDFKLSNDFRAYYARLIMRDYPQYVGFFDIKESIADAMFDSEPGSVPQQSVRTSLRMPVRS